MDGVNDSLLEPQCVCRWCDTVQQTKLCAPRSCGCQWKWSLVFASRLPWSVWRTKFFVTKNSHWSVERGTFFLSPWTPITSCMSSIALIYHDLDLELVGLIGKGLSNNFSFWLNPIPESNRDVMRSLVDVEVTSIHYPRKLLQFSVWQLLQ